MAEKTPVVTDKAPKALPGIYSQAIKANGFVFVSGAVPMDAESGEIVPGDIQAHTVSRRPLMTTATGSSRDLPRQ